MECANIDDSSAGNTKVTSLPENILAVRERPQHSTYNLRKSHFCSFKTGCDNTNNNTSKMARNVREKTQASRNCEILRGGCWKYSVCVWCERTYDGELQ